MKELKRFQTIRRIEWQEVNKQHEPSPSLRGSLGGRLTAEAATRKAGKKVNLKKQSQFMPAIMAVKSFMEGDYDNMPAGGGEENKANQSQFQPRLKEREEAGAGNFAVLK